MNNILKQIEKYYSDFILHDNELFRYSYQISSSYVRKELNLNEEDTYMGGLENVEDKDNYFSMQNVFAYTLSDMDDFIDEKIKELQIKYRDQWED